MGSKRINDTFAAQNDLFVNVIGGVEVAMFAIANGHRHIVEWLQDTYGSDEHTRLLQNRKSIASVWKDQFNVEMENLDNLSEQEFARLYIDPKGKYFGTGKREESVWVCLRKRQPAEDALAVPPELC